MSMAKADTHAAHAKYALNEVLRAAITLYLSNEQRKRFDKLCKNRDRLKTFREVMEASLKEKEI
jgi:hypothetical protein